jgi:hypothetical protein
MIRTLARFDDARRARGAVRALVAASFPAEDVEVHALLADGSRVSVAVGVRSHTALGAAIGLALTAPLGVYLGWTYEIPLMTGALGAGGVGVIVGSTVGLGSWTVATGRAPAGATAFFVTVEAPEGRVPQLQGVLQAAGGHEAALQEVREPARDR